MDSGLQQDLETSSPEHSEESCSCSCCPEFKWKNCKQFGERSIDKVMSEKDHLLNYRKEILFPFIKNYILLESNGTESKGIHLNLHRHFKPYEDRPQVMLKKEIQSIPLFPVSWNVNDVDKTLEHAIKVFNEINNHFNESNLEIYLSHGSSGRPSISVINAYAHFVRAENLDWRLYNLTLDIDYGSDIGEGVTGYQMTPDSSKRWQNESAEQKKEITRLESELSKTTALLGGLKKEITHLKTELAGLDSELLKVTSLLEKKSEEE